MAEVSLKEINKIAIPAIIAGISEPLISLGDTAILGQLPDSAVANSGIAGASAFYLTIVWVLAQTKSATSAIVSRALGKNELGKVDSLVPQAIFFSLAMGLLFYVGTVPFIKPILGLLDLKGQALTYGLEYYQIRAIGFPFILAAFTMFGVFRGLQNTYWAMVISIVASLLNLGLDLLFVHGLEGVVKPMGVKGAAYASLIVQIWMFVAAIFVLYKKTRFKLIFHKKIDPMLKELLGIASNLFVRTIALNFTILLALKSAAGISNEHNAAHAMAYQIWLFTAFFIDGYANAANAISGKLLGSGNILAMKNMVKRILKYNIMIACMLALILSTVYYQIGHWLINKESVVNIFEDFFWITLLIFPINAIAFTLDGVFKGLGEAKFLRQVLIYASLLAFLPVLWLSDYFNWELQGVWFAMMVWITVRSLLPWLRFQKLINQSIKQ
jgi:putative MATE family efflux protein